jgi:hypothetical protein
MSNLQLHEISMGSEPFRHGSSHEAFCQGTTVCGAPYLASSLYNSSKSYSGWWFGTCG